MTTKVLNFDRAAFQSHREATLELILARLGSSGGTARYNRSASWCMRCGRTADLADDANEANKPNSDESLYAQCTVVDGRVMVQDVSIQS